MTKSLLHPAASKERTVKWICKVIHDHNDGFFSVLKKKKSLIGMDEGTYLSEFCLGHHTTQTSSSILFKGKIKRSSIKTGYISFTGTLIWACKFFCLQYQLKKPGGLLFTKKHDILPFENVGLLENYSQRRGASLFIFASSNKKHPHSLIFGNHFNLSMLLLFEPGPFHFFLQFVLFESWKKVRKDFSNKSNDI